jgi:hypothetical protein
VASQLLDILDEIPGGILPQLKERLGQAAAALIEEHDQELGRIEVASVGGNALGSRAAVEDHNRLALRVPVQLVVDLVKGGDLQIAHLERLDRRQQLRPLFERRRCHGCRNGCDPSQEQGTDKKAYSHGIHLRDNWETP